MKITKTYTLDHELVDALKKYANGRSMSALVEQGIRLVIGLPQPSEESEADENATRTQRDALTVLKGLPEGWHSSRKIAEQIGCSHNITEKALRQLTLQGRVFLWGEGLGPLKVDRNLRETRWGVRSPVELVEAWASKGTEDYVDAVVSFREMFTGISKEWAVQCDLAFAKAVGVSANLVEFGALTPEDASHERLMRQSQEYNSPEGVARRARESAAWLANVKAQHEAAHREQEAAKAYDVQARGEVVPDGWGDDDVASDQVTSDVLTDS